MLPSIWKAATRAARFESQHWTEAAEAERAAVRGALSPAAAGVVLKLGVLALGGTFVEGPEPAAAIVALDRGEPVDIPPAFDSLG